MNSAPLLGALLGAGTVAGVTLYFLHRGHKARLLEGLVKELSLHEERRRQLAQDGIQTRGVEEKKIKPLQKRIWELQGEKGKLLKRLSELEEDLAGKSERIKALSKDGLSTSGLLRKIQSLEEEIQKLKGKLEIKPPPPKIEPVSFDLEKEGPIYALDNRVEMGQSGSLFLIRNIDLPEKEPVYLCRSGFLGMKPCLYEIPTQEGIPLMKGDILAPLPSNGLRFKSIGEKAVFKTVPDFDFPMDLGRPLKTVSVVDTWPARSCGPFTEEGHLYLSEKGLHAPFLLREASLQRIRDTSRLMNREEIEKTLRRLDIPLPGPTDPIKAVLIGRKAQPKPDFLAARTPLSLRGLRDRHMIVEFTEAEACYSIRATDDAKFGTCLVRDDIPYRVPHAQEGSLVLEPEDTIILGGNVRREEDPKKGTHYFSDASYRFHLVEGKGWLEFIGTTQIPDAFLDLLSPSVQALIAREDLDPNSVKEKIWSEAEEDDPLSRLRPVYLEDIERFRRLCFFRYLTQHVIPIVADKERMWKLASDEAELNAASSVWNELTPQDRAFFWRGETEGVGPDGRHDPSLPQSFLRVYLKIRMDLLANGSIPVGELKARWEVLMPYVLKKLDRTQESPLQTLLKDSVLQWEAIRHLIQWQYHDLKWDRLGTPLLDHCTGLVFQEVQREGVPFLDASNVVSEPLMGVIKKVVTSCLTQAIQADTQGSEQEKQRINEKIIMMGDAGLDLRAATETLLKVLEETPNPPTLMTPPQII